MSPATRYAVVAVDRSTGWSTTIDTFDDVSVAQRRANELNRTEPTRRHSVIPFTPMERDGGRDE
jgi:hypothetical protein